jgi:hypothetical protein
MNAAMNFLVTIKEPSIKSWYYRDCVVDTQVQAMVLIKIAESNGGTGWIEDCIHDPRPWSSWRLN